MDKLISPLAFLTLHLLVQHPLVANAVSSTSICSKSPYPELCNSLMTTTTQTTLDVNKNLFAFRDMSLRATLARAQYSHKVISQMDTSSFNELGKSAWADCVELYEDSIYQLNRSVDFIHVPLDAQTWLSAAIANEKTCQNGFLDFNLSSHLNYFSMLISDFSKSLSNSLAINRATSLASSSELYSTNKPIRNRRLLAHDEFPEWVSVGDRKLLRSEGAAMRADIVVARDGSGDYRMISEALAAAVKRRSGARRFVIYVKRGIYRENVEVKKSMKNLMFIGDGVDATVVTSNRNVQDGSTAFRSATFAVSGEGFIARGMTFENTAGPQKHQAVALRSGADFSVFYGCSFKGYQDTLYVHSQRQFYRECDIYGTVDFIFGDAAAVIQNSNIYIRRPMSGQKNTVTAQGRSDPNENTAIVIHNSRVAAASDLRATGSVRSYLGRPWRQYSRTVFIRCTIDGVIDPAGWLPWSGDFALRTLYYGEYMNNGRGAAIGGRVRWPGFHVITSAVDAGRFSVGNFLAGDSWIPATGVPFSSVL